MTETFDLIVLGGGRAASLAIAAAGDGLKTALIERDRLGGTCPNRGCVPSKLLIGFAEHARQVRDADRHFIDAEFKGIDLKRAFGVVNLDIAGVDPRYEARAEKAGVTLIRGEGRFVGQREIEVNGRRLTAERIVIATGSRPRKPPFSGLPVWTSDDLFPLREVPPNSLIIIGGGVVGCELASFFAAVGVETSIFVRKDRMLGKEDAEIEEVFRTEFSKHVGTHCHASLKNMVHDGNCFSTTFDTADGEKKFRAERVLFAIGRVPNSDALDLEKTGVATDDDGFIPVNEHLETNVQGIYATGDINGRWMLEHAAAREVFYLRKKFLKDHLGPIDEQPLGHAVYAHPELASVGATEEELKEKGAKYVSVCEDWINSARAESMRIEYPRVKLLVSPDDYSILGCHLVGPESSTLIHQVIAVMKLKNDVRALADMIFIHPALNECLLAAAVAAIGKVKRAG